MSDDERAAVLAICDWLDGQAAEIDKAVRSFDKLDSASWVWLLRAVKALRAGLAQTERELEQRLLGTVAGKETVVDGVGVVKVRTATKRSGWDHDALWRLVVAYALDERRVDEKTGEYESAHEAVGRVLSECARPEWRVSALKARGIDPDEFCVTEFGRRSVQLP